MALEVMRLILAEEQAAGVAVQEAQQSANEVVKAAEAAAAEQERAAAVENRGLYHRLLEEARAGVQSELDGGRQAAREDIENLAQGARARLPEAAEWIVSEVIHGRR